MEPTTVLLLIRAARALLGKGHGEIQSRIDPAGDADRKKENFETNVGCAVAGTILLLVAGAVVYIFVSSITAERAHDQEEAGAQKEWDRNYDNRQIEWKQQHEPDASHALRASAAQALAALPLVRT